MNRIDAPGTSEGEWRAWPGLAGLPLLDVSRWRNAVVVAAHPDDEVLGVGGLLAQLDIPVRLIAVTDGEKSHPHLPPAEITAVRRAETEAALAHLGDCEVHRLGMPDADVRDDELTPVLKELVRGFDVCLAPWEYDAHCDHEAAGRSALAAGAAGGVEVLRFPIWAWHWAKPADPAMPWADALRVPLTPDAAARKRAAIGCFTSQLGTILPPAIVEHFERDQEVLFR
ncbi:PIG-L deacetylase family protein [Actinomadura hibisca]|uniref:PIG-L deacetylase family protein n=1 Tax=Actinomadura hibisca TaxID=68565 RepID=UPI000B1FFB45|nr:PIG-L family deacetylase [Actinomadura hibisca]